MMTCFTRLTSWSWSWGLRKGELLGLAWDLIDFDRAELYISEQVQRVSGQLVRRQTKTEASDAPLPLPDLCVAALKLRKRQQEADREQAGDAWIDTGLVFTTRHGTPIEPRNFNRSFDRRVEKAKVSKITVHGTRKTGGSLLATLDVHPRVAMQDPAAHQDRRHDGDLHRGPFGRHPRRAEEARPMARRIRAVAALCCCTKIKNGRSRDRNRPLTCVGHRQNSLTRGYVWLAERGSRVKRADLPVFCPFRSGPRAGGWSRLRRAGLAALRVLRVVRRVRWRWLRVR